MDPCQGSSSRRSTTATGLRHNKHEEVMQEQLAVGAVAGAAPSYSLFPEETGSRSSGGLIQLNELFSVDRQQPKLEVDSKAIKTVQPCIHTHGGQLPTFYPRLGDILCSSSQTMDEQDTKVKGTTQNHVPVVAAPASVSGGNIVGALGNVEKGTDEEATPLSDDAMMKTYEQYLVAVHAAYFHSCNDPNMITSGRYFQQVVLELKTNYASDVLMAHYGENLTNVDTSVIRQQSAPSDGSTQLQHYGASGSIPATTHQEQTDTLVMNPTLRLMNIKGQVAASCADADRSHFVQHAIELATPQEILMVYEEIIPCVRTLAIDMFGNHCVQKILEHGPMSSKRKLIGQLISHVVPLSLNMYGCRVIQKALEVGELHQKILIVNELSQKVLKCARHQSASHVIQKCIECLPPKHIQSIIKSFCGRAKALSTDVYGSRVIQKVLDHCSNSEVYHTLTAEIIEFANKLSADPFGNYVVQHLLKHGDQATRSMIVRKFSTRMVSMCYNKLGSIVLEKCLLFGSQEDRQLITNEILGNAGGQHFEHLVDIMINPHGNFVIQKMVVTADEHQVALLLDIVWNNMAHLMRYPHGRYVIAAMNRFLSAKQVIPASSAAQQQQ